MSVGKTVKRLREKLGMNQKELATASRITQATLSRIESEEVKQVKSGALRRLSDALGVTVDYLVGRTDALTPSDIVESDPTAQYIFRGYEKLSPAGKEQLRSFIGFLEEQEGEVGEKE